MDLGLQIKKSWSLFSVAYFMTGQVIELFSTYVKTGLIHRKDVPEIVLARHLCVIVKMLNEVLIVIILWCHCCGIYSQLLIVPYKGQFRTVQINDKEKDWEYIGRKSHERKEGIISSTKSVHRLAPIIPVSEGSINLNVGLDLSRPRASKCIKANKHWGIKYSKISYFLSSPWGFWHLLQLCFGHEY